MGEAKRRLERVRNAFLAEIEAWAFQPTEWEVQAIAEIQTLPVVTVTRLPDDQLAYMQMVPRLCHQNAAFMEKNDPRGRMKHVTGWWLEQDCYILHSVIHEDGRYFCVTPAPFESENSFSYVPDQKIEWRDEADRRIAYRDGFEIRKGLRSNPERKIAEIAAIKKRLLSGMNPYEAMRLFR